MNIQITGASGAGKTFLGRALAKELNTKFLDTDDVLWVWKDDIQPYTVATTDEDACAILRETLDLNESTVVSGLFYPWSESLIDKFDLLVIVETSSNIRKERIIQREYELYGDRFKVGGDMYAQFNMFLEWALNYDTSDDRLGSKKETLKWAKKFKCPVIYIDGSKSLRENINTILEKINSKLIYIEEDKKYDNTGKIKKR